MYVKIRNNKLLSWSENYREGYEYVDIDYTDFSPEEYLIKNGELIDMSDTDYYKDEIQEQAILKAKEILKEQLRELDLKRIRSVCEPMLKDQENGQTWMEYYTEQIKDLRRQIAAL